MTDLALLAHDSLALARGAEHRSKMARFREMFEYVCAAIDAGVRHLAIRDLLAKHGLDLSVATLDVMISRVRRERNLPLPRDARRAAARPVAPRTSLSEQQAPEPASAGDDAPATAAQRQAGPVQSIKALVAAVARPKVALPDDWLTSETLTHEQRRSLTPEQRAARQQARKELYFPNPLRDPSPKPASAAVDPDNPERPPA